MKRRLAYRSSELLSRTVVALVITACGSERAPEPEPRSGLQLYEEHGCALCHGPRGQGDGPVAPTLDPPPRDLGDPSSYRIGPTESEIASTIEKGILVFRGSGMPSYAHIPAGDRLEIARYVVSLQNAPPETGNP